MTVWVRFEHQSGTGFGTITGDAVVVHQGDMFDGAASTDEVLQVEEVDLLIPCVPGKMIGLANNSRAVTKKNGIPAPDYPHYFIKPPNTFAASGATIRNPGPPVTRVFYEAELGIVIGRQCRDVSEDEASNYIFGYTCVNDVTAFQLLEENPHFPQWTRAKAFDTFAPFGPAISTDIDLREIAIRAVLNGRERQNYAVSDLIFAPDRIVSALSAEITLSPGDVIACGTGPGALPMKPGSTIEIVIDGIGTLRNVFQ